MYTDSLFTEENLKGMKKLLKRVCEGNPDSAAEEVKYSLNAMYDTITADLMDEKKIEARMAELMDSSWGEFTFYAVSGLRYSPLIYFSRHDKGGETSGPCIVYEGIEGDGVETEAMPVYTRKKVVKSDMSAFRWHHTDLESVIYSAKNSGFTYVVVNPDTTPLLLKISDTENLLNFYRDLNEAVAREMAGGVNAGNLFPALMDKFYMRQVQCTFADGSVKSGLALPPEDDSKCAFEIETPDEAGEGIPVRLEDLLYICTNDPEDLADSTDSEE